MFWARVTGRMVGADADVVSEANVKRLEGCEALLEFMRYMLIRDPQRRPSIRSALQKFRFASEEALRWRNTGPRPAGVTDSVVMTPSGTGRIRKDSASGGTPDTARSKREASRVQAVAAAPAASTRILSRALPARLASMRWTHIVDFRASGSSPLPLCSDIPYVMAIEWRSTTRTAEELVTKLPAVADFLRHAAIYHGEVLFVDGDIESPPGDEGEPRVARRGGLAMAALLALAADTYRLDVFAFMSYLSSQILVAAVRPDAISAVTAWLESKRRVAWTRCQGMVRIACLCGGCSWHVTPEWLTRAPEEQPEPLRALAGDPYLRWLRARFGVGLERLHWLELPEGVFADDCSDCTTYGSLTRGIAVQAEALGEAMAPSPFPCPLPGASLAPPPRRVVRRFRCHTCRALTHAELIDGGDEEAKR
eukprot:CAMPEP_0176121960 /NCGR_PEP_ID=MMETSP0120_2-20121206/61406_1 /TAXON_ID=160619 /ORGANISM="Kryptoperidinium foliaceum, Strain CCMP 1326" /LENGTH=422 /DNA_ID=CAMNT_0017456545 /DNA_START=18 /DNA_END=1283 /DNA_ORIENTATION=-